MTLGEMLRWHRGLCGECVAIRPCAEYREIIDEFTEARQVYVGATAPCTVLSVREGVAT